MKRRPTKSARAAILTLIVLIVLPAQVLAQAKTPIEDDAPPAKPSIVSQVFDVVILRPLGFALLAVGSAMFVPAVIVTAPGGRDHIDGALEFFVINPYRETFERPLGDF